MGTVDALAREVGAVGVLLHKLGRDQWEAPTRCDPMTIMDLAAHVLRGALRIEESLDADPSDEQPERDSVTYWQMDLDAEAPVIVRRAQELATRLGSPAGLLKEWDTRWVRALQRSRAADKRAVRPTPFGTIAFEEYLKTRCVEVVVHHMDLDDAIGREPHPDAEAVAIVGDVLRGLLGTDLRPFGTDDVRFALIGTGRAELSDREREFLGPLIQRFPLLR